MTDISLQVENGKIVAYDEQGNKVPLPAEAIATENIHRTAKAASDHTEAGDQRQFITTERDEIWLDANNGDDDAIGSQSNPIQSLEEMYTRLPMILEHRLEIWLKEGSYSTPSNQIGPVQIFTGSDYEQGNSPLRNPLSIRSAPGAAKSNTIIDGNLQRLPTSGPELDKPSLSNLTVNGTVAPGTGCVNIQNVTFTGTASDIISGRAISTHSDATIHLTDCTFETGVDTGIRAARNCKIYINRCDGAVSGTFLDANYGATAFVRDYTFPIGHTKQWDLKNASKLIGPEGSVYEASTRFADAWSDNQFDGRIADSRGGWQEDYNNLGGSPTVSGNQLVLPAGDSTSQFVGTKSNLLIGPRGTFKAEFSLSSTASTGTLEFRVFREGSSDYWSAELNAGGSANAKRRESNTNKRATGSWTADTATKTVELEVKDDISSGNAGGRLRINGSDIATLTDDFIPNPGRVTVLNQLDSEVKISNWSIQE